MNILKRLKLKPEIIYAELAIFDVIHPKFPVGGFRHAEHSYYFENLIDVVCVHGYSYTKKSNQSIKESINKYCQALGRPEWIKRFFLLNEIQTIKPQLAYCLMVNSTLQFLPIFEKFNIPFCICVTPGGGFCIDNEISDQKCQRIIQSPCFRYLIATQEIINDYLINKISSLKGKSEVIYGGFSQIETTEVLNHKDISNKKYLDIAFVAYNYGNNGFDKGFDIFCDVIKQALIDDNDRFRFHIVGNWESNKIDFASQSSEKVIYHGVLAKEELLNFYSKVDVIINPYRLSDSGSFNGFPMSPDGSMCGVALFTTNPLKMKTPYVSGQDVVEIGIKPSEIFKTLVYYEQNRNSLKLIAKRGQEKTIKLRSRQVQAEARIKIFERLLGHAMNRY